MTSLSDQIVAVLGEHHYWHMDSGRCQCGFALSTEYYGAFVPRPHAKVMYRHLTIEEHAAHLAAQLVPVVEAAQMEALRGVVAEIEAMAARDYDTSDCDSPGGVTIVATGRNAALEAAAIVAARAAATEPGDKK